LMIGIVIAIIDRFKIVKKLNLGENNEWYYGNNYRFSYWKHIFVYGLPRL
jgi:hypothetical protein